LDRKRLALVSYVALMVVLMTDFVLVVLFPGPSIFLLMLGPIFVVLGVQLVFFRQEHARVWERFGAPTASIFAFVGFLFIVLGLYFAFDAPL
jgi:hypothetical protein